ncbi:hypothetical protein LPJ64_002131 [Coemansia asiatica]|uniref:Tetratricopeptide repeat protein n=1 Tax=Coemansia asiatica TaxID=1052880 RepID=A0A9W7XNQ2_9FUNG|nr:hypothetical protein LPJ64_002131 [Coemansia asiatica]
MEQSGNNYYNAGVCAHLLGKTDEAIDQWERAIAMDMKLPEAHVNLGTTYFVKKGERERGLRHMQRALRLKPKDMEIRFNLGAMYDSVGELELAKKLLEDCVRCDIENADVLLRNVNAKIAAKALAKEKK